MKIGPGCDLCGELASTPLPQDPRIHVCSTCGFLYVPQRRSSAEIAASWADIYSSGAYDPEWPAVQARLFYVAAWIEQTIGLNGKSLLDIGAGNGRFMRQAEKRGACTFGIEPAASKEQHHIINVAIEDCTLKEQFDIVTINWTLENCGDCLAMLRFARERCKPDGWVIVATGSRILVPFKKPLSKYLNKDIPADLHCFRWSFRSLTAMMGYAGLDYRHVNPYEECDWLVVGASPTKNDSQILAMARDDPKEVLAYFAAWERITETPAQLTSWRRA